MKWLLLRVGGQRIGVFLVRPTHSKLQGCVGIYYPEEGRIYIANDLTPDVREDTLFHELDHVVNEVSGANKALATHVPRKSLDAVEEAFVSARTPLWHALVKDLGFRFPKGPNE